MAPKKQAPKAEPVAAASAPAKIPAAPVVTLKQLAAAIAEKQHRSRKETHEAVTALVSEVVSHLKNGDRVRINQLGILEVKHRPARTVRNPATGEPLDVGESKKIAFRVAKELKDAVLA